MDEREPYTQDEHDRAVEVGGIFALLVAIFIIAIFLIGG